MVAEAIPGFLPLLSGDWTPPRTHEEAQLLYSAALHLPVTHQHRKRSIQDRVALLFLLHFISPPPFKVFTRTLSKMAASASSSLPGISQADINAFHEHLLSSKRILALVGAGLSASSGLPTFRGVGGLWRSHDAMELATPDAFDDHPALVWQFYNYRRHMALKAKPNPAHYALAELARKKEGFQTLSQNVDG
jgi:hypothetical protein